MSYDLGRCRECQEPIRITTLSILHDQFEAASPEVQHRILEVITLNRLWMTLAHVLTASRAGDGRVPSIPHRQGGNP